LARLCDVPFRTEPLTITSDEQQELRDISASRSLPAGDVFEARLILMLAAGRSYADIRRQLHTTAPTISHFGRNASWKAAFWD
jgi:hypothetical protein